MLEKDQIKKFKINSMVQFNELTRNIYMLEKSIMDFKKIREDIRCKLNFQLEVNKELRKVMPNNIITRITHKKSLLRQRKTIVREMKYKYAINISKEELEYLSMDTVSQLDDIIFYLEECLSKNKNKLDILDEGLRAIQTSNLKR